MIDGLRNRFYETEISHVDILAPVFIVLRENGFGCGTTTWTHLDSSSHCMVVLDASNGRGGSHGRTLTIIFVICDSYGRGGLYGRTVNTVPIVYQW